MMGATGGAPDLRHSKITRMLKLLAGARSSAALQRSLVLGVPARALSVGVDAGAALDAAGATAEASKEPKSKPTPAPPTPETTWATVVVGEIVRFHAHPAADRLKVCHVDVGDRENLLQIICGAPNVREGVRVPVAKVGTKLAIADPDSGDT
jgi:tRNA-binding EMAP/Myf-like protein